MSVERALRIAAVGDVALGGEYLARACPPGARMTYPFTEINSRLSSADLVIVNLEGPIGEQGPKRAGRTALLHNHPDVLDWLASLPNCVCCLANNHALDYGVEGLERTIEMLDRRGIRHLGAGSNAASAARALHVDINGLKLAIVAYTTDEVHVGSVLATPSQPGCNGLPTDPQLRSEIHALATTSDIVIAILHWGHEFHNFPTPSQVACTRLIADAGARLVIGHHPHVQQGTQLMNGSLICHSLGNLILPEMRAETGRVQFRKAITKQFAILEATVSPVSINAWRIIGGRCAKNYRLREYSGNDRLRFETEIRDFTEPLDTAGYGDFWELYRAERLRSLKRESLSEVIPKLAQLDLRTLLRTFSAADVGRISRRLASMVLRKPKV